MDPLHSAWPGNIIESGQAAHHDLLEALVSEVEQRSLGLTLPEAMPEIDLSEFVATKVGPMVRGLFPARERDQVQDLLTSSVVFLTPANIVSVLHDCQWLNTAWDLANLYLNSLGADLLGDDPPRIVGLSEHTRCYVSIGYFSCEERFADFVVHEAAHIFHNCKRHTAGMTEKRHGEWLLDIDFAKRETFAYACEAYSRILELTRGPSERNALLAEFAKAPPPNDERVDEDEYLDIVAEAVSARNGWKRILDRCSPS